MRHLAFFGLLKAPILGGTAIFQSLELVQIFLFAVLTDIQRIDYTDIRILVQHRKFLYFVISFKTQTMSGCVILTVKPCLKLHFILLICFPNYIQLGNIIGKTNQYINIISRRRGWTVTRRAAHIHQALFYFIMRFFLKQRTLLGPLNVTCYLNTTQKLLFRLLPSSFKQLEIPLCSLKLLQMHTIFVRGIKTQCTCFDYI